MNISKILPFVLFLFFGYQNLKAQCTSIICPDDISIEIFDPCDETSSEIEDISGYPNDTSGSALFDELTYQSIPGSNGVEGNCLGDEEYSYVDNNYTESFDCSGDGYYASFERTWSVFQSSGMLIDDCVQVIFLIDLTPPVAQVDLVSFFEDQDPLANNWGNLVLECPASGNWAEPDLGIDVIDNCSPNNGITMTSNIGPNDQLADGLNNIEYQFIDGCGNVLFVEWDINVTCVTPCMGEPIVTDCMDSANNVLCDLNDLNGFMSCTPELNPINFGGFCNGLGDLDNPSFFSFIAGSTDIAVTIGVSDCLGTANGIGVQANITDVCGSNVCYGDSGANCETSQFSFNATGLTIGFMYQLIVDGCNGDQCAYTITIDSAPPFAIPDPGVPVATSNVSSCTFDDSDIQICSGTALSFFPENLENENHFFCWSVNDTTGFSVLNNDTNCFTAIGNFVCSSDYSTCGPLDLQFNQTGTYEVCLEEMNNGCDNNILSNYCWDVIVSNSGTLDWGSYEICEVELPFFSVPPHPVTGESWLGQNGSALLSGQNTFIVEDDCDCTYEQLVTINVLPVDDLPILEYSICANEITNWVDPIYGVSWTYVSTFGPGLNLFENVLIENGSQQIDWQGNNCDINVTYQFDVYNIPGEIIATTGTACNVVLSFDIDQASFPSFMDENDIAYQWADANGNIISLTPSISVSSMGTYNLETSYVIPSETCTFSYSYDVMTVGGTPSAPQFSNVPSVICGNELTGIDLAVDPGSTAIYNWELQNGMITSGIGFNNIVVSVVDLTLPLGVSVFSTVPGCGESPVTTIEIEVEPTPVASIVGPVTGMLGEELKFEADILSGDVVEYNWSVSPTTALPPNVMDLSILPLVWDASGQYEVSLRVISSNGCVSESESLIVNILGSEASDLRMFIFGNSLVHHELQVNPTLSDETSVPHWLHFLSEEAGKTYEVAGQYGFLPQHANLPPFSQWGFDFAVPAWDSDNETFAEADFSHILITPGNFIQWQDPDINYPNENVSPVSASTTIVEWCATQEDELNFYIYEGWPEMAPYLNYGFPPTVSEWDNYNEFLQTEYADWFDDFHGMVKEANSDECIALIPVARLISKLLQKDPYNQIAIGQLYEDDAPHGRPSIYFLASMITYMAVYEEEAPLGYMPNDLIDPIIVDNYTAISSFFWNELLEFNDGTDNSKVFCKLNVAVDEPVLDASPFSLVPNPFSNEFAIRGIEREVEIEIYDISGKWLESQKVSALNSIIQMEQYVNGIYFIRIKDGERVDVLQKLIKLGE